MYTRNQPQKDQTEPRTMSEPSQQGAEIPSYAQQAQEQERQIKQQRQDEIAYEEISKGSKIPVREWKKSINLDSWDNPEFDFV